MSSFVAALKSIAEASRGWVRAPLLAAMVSAGCAVLPSADALACPPSARPQPVPVMEAARAHLAKGEPLRILAIGSSSTAGVGASRRQNSFPAQLERRLGAALGPQAVTVVNAGVSGERASSTLKRLEEALAGPQKPDLVIWQVGTNDSLFGGTPPRLADLVSRGLDAAAAAGVPVILIDQQYFPLLFDAHGYERFVAAVDDTAKARQVPLLPRYAMLKEWSAEDPKGFRGLFAWDRFHMNDAGYACLADLLSSTILEALRGPQGASPGAGAPMPQRKPDRPGEAALRE